MAVIEINFSLWCIELEHFYHESLQAYNGLATVRTIGS